MGKVIFWIVVFFLVLLALRLVSVYKARDDAREEKDNKPSGKRDDKPANDSMVKCVECGVYLPKATSIMKANGWSCQDAKCSNRR